MKFKDPVVIFLTNKENFLLYNCEKIQINNLYQFKQEHYGFELFVNGTRLNYETEFRIDKVIINDDFLFIYEVVKKKPWKFMVESGTLISSSSFYSGTFGFGSQFIAQYAYDDNEDTKLYVKRK